MNELAGEIQLWMLPVFVAVIAVSLGGLLALAIGSRLSLGKQRGLWSGSLLLFALIPFVPCLRFLREPGPPELSSFSAIPLQPVTKIAYEQTDWIPWMLTIATLVWLLGAFVLLFRFYQDYRSLKRYRKAAKPMPPDQVPPRFRNLQILVTDEAIPPCSGGLRHPYILLPMRHLATSDAAALRMVLEHERGHIQGRDLLRLWLQRLVVALHWWNPIVHAIGNRWGLVRELRCDQAVLRQGNDRQSYVRLLMGLAEEQVTRVPAATGFGSSFRTLRERLVHLVNISDKEASDRDARFSIAAGVLLTIVLVCGLYAALQWTKPMRSSDGLADVYALERERLAEVISDLHINAIVNNGEKILLGDHLLEKDAVLASPLIKDQKSAIILRTDEESPYHTEIVSPDGESTIVRLNPHTLIPVPKSVERSSVGHSLIYDDTDFSRRVIQREIWRTGADSPTQQYAPPSLRTYPEGLESGGLIPRN